MKILYLIHQFYPEFYTGTEKIFLQLATMMQKFGHKVKVMTYSSYQDSFYEQSLGDIVYKEFVYQGIPVLALRHKTIPEDRHYALENKELSKVASDLISREKPDVVHVGHSMGVAELVKVLHPLNIPYIVTLTDFFLICPKYTLITSENSLCCGPDKGKACQIMCPELPGDFITNRLEIARDILFKAKVVTSLSKFVADICEKEYPSLDIKAVSPGLRYSSLRTNGAAYGIDERIRFCYAGSLNPHKGVHVLIDAFKQVCADEACLKIYGSGPDETYVSQLMAAAKDDRRIEFCGVYSDNQVGEILGNVDVVITPSLWYETYCLVLHEALACNVPVIASDVGVMAEKIKDGANGFLFTMGDSQHLKEKLQMISDSPSMLSAMKHNIDKMTIPSLEQEAYTYGTIYARILKEREKEKQIGGH